MGTSVNGVLDLCKWPWNCGKFNRDASSFVVLQDAFGWMWQGSEVGKITSLAALLDEVGPSHG